jgi:hypothetical protein
MSPQSMEFWLAAVLAPLILVIALYWLRVFRLAREGVRHAARNIFYAFAAAYLTYVGLLLLLFGLTEKPAGPLAILLGFVFLIFGLRELSAKPVKRKRAVPARIRRAVIARDLGDEPFDPDRHHVDHIVPFVRGGSHTTDNLRVIEKKRNLQKGAKYPRWWELW